MKLLGDLSITTETHMVGSIRYTGRTSIPNVRIHSPRINTVEEKMWCKLQTLPYEHLMLGKKVEVLFLSRNRINFKLYGVNPVDEVEPDIFECMVDHYEIL